MKKWLDITRPVNEDMICWPGRESPRRYWEKKISEGDYCNLTFWQMSSHCGTHIDAPLHFVEDALPVDRISPEVLIGDCSVIDMESLGVEILDLPNIEQYYGQRRILICSKHSRPCQIKAYRNHRALMTLEAAASLIEKGTMLIGTDRLSVDSSEGRDRTLHELILGAGCVIVEGLCLEEISAGHYQIYIFPLRLTGAEASPARAFLIPQGFE